MKLVHKTNKTVLGVFDPNGLEAQLEYLGVDLNDYDCIKTQSQQDRENLKFLADTDWLIQRHQEQLALQVETKLSNTDYVALMKKRHALRNQIVDNQALMKYKLDFIE